MDQDWLFTSEAFVCDLRTAGVLVRDGKLLIQRDQDGAEHALPGGHVRIGETLEDALRREFREETGADIHCRRLLWTEESFWRWNGRQAHSIAFYFLIGVRDGAALPADGEFVPQKDNNSVVLGWLPLNQIDQTVLYPAFLKDEIRRLNDAPKHFISR